MLYGDMSAFISGLGSLESGLAVLPMSPTWCSLAVAWVQRPAALGRLVNWLTDRLLLRDSVLLTLTKGEAHEMRLLGVYREQKGPSSLQLLPTQPNSALGLPRLASTERLLLDPAAWGQFVGGTPHPGQGPGFLDESHTLGEAMRIRRVTIGWDDDGFGAQPFTTWCPFSVEGSDCVTHRLLNLHVHSKNLAPFMTCGAVPEGTVEQRIDLLQTAQAFFEDEYDHDEW